MRLQEIIDKIVFSQPAEWRRIRRRGDFWPDPLCTHETALAGGAFDSPDVDAPAEHTDYALLTSDVAIAMRWGAVAGGDYHEPWATRCPDPSAWTGLFDILYQGNLVHRDVYVSVDGDRYFLPLPRDLHDMRVPGDYAQVTALLSTLSRHTCASEGLTYLRRTGLVLADEQWPRQ